LQYSNGIFKLLAVPKWLGLKAYLNALTFSLLPQFENYFSNFIVIKALSTRNNRTKK